MNTLLASKKLGKKYEKKYSNFNTLLSNLLRDKSAARYLGKEIKGKSISLDPGNQHLNRIAQLPIPATQPGWYLLTVTLNNGYQFHRLLSLSDLVLIRRSIPEGNLWFLAEAKTGAPVEGGKISLLRYRKDKTLQTKQVKGTTDKNGVLIETLPPNDSNSSTYYNFLGIATHGDSYTVTGERNVWYSGESRMSLNNKASNSYGCFFLESQPVYRPGQTARFRGVLFRPDFANPGTKDCAGKKLTLTILGPTGDKGIFPKQTVTTDATGGFDLELLIPNGAPLGQYRVTLDFRESDRTLYAPLVPDGRIQEAGIHRQNGRPGQAPQAGTAPSPFPSRRTIMRRPGERRKSHHHHHPYPGSGCLDPLLEMELAVFQGVQPLLHLFHARSSPHGSGKNHSPGQGGQGLRGTVHRAGCQGLRLPGHNLPCFRQRHGASLREVSCFQAR